MAKSKATRGQKTICPLLAEMSAEQLLAYYTPRVMSSVNAFIRREPSRVNLKDDFYAEGLLRLWSSITKFKAGKVNNLPSYIKVSLWSGFWEVVRTDDCIQSPRNCSARRDMRLELSKVVEDELRQKRLKKNPTAKQLLYPACVGKVDKKIASMLIDRATIRQIAKAVGLSIAAVRAKKKAIGLRLDKLEP